MKGKVFGIGLSKTGTSSLAEALNVLGINTIHYPHDAITYQELKAGQFRLSILNQYDGIADTPVVPYYPQFDKLYPGSKFILTIREKKEWLASVEKHWQVASTYEDQPLKREFQHFIRTAVYGCIDFQKDRFSYVYDVHEQQVLRYFADRPDDLLVMNICEGEGWEVLCPFLHLPVPGEPFPHANEWMSKLIRATQTFSSVIPVESTSVLIDDQLLGNDFAQGRRCLPFPEENGIYCGPPENGEKGIAALKETIARYEADHLVLAWPSFWWLDTYPEMNGYIKNNFNHIASTPELILYKIR